MIVIFSCRHSARHSLVLSPCKRPSITAASVHTLAAKPMFAMRYRPRNVPDVVRAKAAARYIAAAAASEGVVPGDYVEVHYVGTLDDGTEFDNSSGRDPLPFLVGAGRVVPGFELIVTGMHMGEKKKQRIEPAQAYGEWSQQLTVKVPTKDAPEGLKEGVMVQLQNGMTATVTSMDDEFVTIDANPPLAGKALTFEVELVKHTRGVNMKSAAFGAGCFWGVELTFQRVPGVIITEVGYSQGFSPEVTYEEVCSGNSGHVEIVNVLYDEQELPFEKLCEVFFEKHDPTTLNRQGNDVGPQYRSGIYYSSPEQKEAAERVIERMQQKYSGQVVTELEELKNYCRAEEYHQQYLERGGRFGRAQSAKKNCTDPIRCYG